jgi:hypothetical protein
MSELQLRDIHLPEAVSWWPPAPGWWILLILIIVTIYFIPHLIKKLKQVPLNKQAIGELKQIEHSYKTHQDKTLLVQALSILLRRACMSYLSRQKIASLTGPEWIKQLNTLTEKNYFSDEASEILLNAPYQKNHNYDAETLLTSCNNWINALPKKVSL